MRLAPTRLAGSLAFCLVILGARPARAQAAQQPGFPGATLVICHDGTSSTAGNYACDRHGGVKALPGARGEVNAALKMEDHKSTVPRGARAVPKPVTATPPGATPDSAQKSDSAARRPLRAGSPPRAR